MGLDIYFYKVKNKETCDNYLSIKKEYDKVYDKFETKYKEQLTAAWKKWENWYNGENERISALPEDSNEAEYNYLKDEPSYDISNFMDEVEKLEWTTIQTKYNIAKGEMHIDYQEDIDELYMRKENWMVHFVQERHPERLIHDTEFGSVLDGSCAVLDKDDIKELIHRMDKVLGNTEKLQSYEDATGKQETNGIFRTEEAMDWYEKWKPTEKMVEMAEIYLPTMSRFFFGSTDYDYWYFQALQTYRERFQKWLDESEPDEVLYYEESW